MPTAEERYAAATAYVRQAISAVENRAIGYTVNPITGVAEWYVGSTRAAPVRGDLAQLDARWLRTVCEPDRERIAADAEKLAVGVMETLPPTGCVRDAGLIDIQTPGSIKAEIETVAGLIHQLDAEVKASRVEESFKVAWRAFVDEWEEFYRGHEGWLDRVWYSTYEKAVEYRKRRLAWSEKFAALGGKASGPVDTPPETARDQVQTFGKLLLLGGGLLVAYKLVIRERLNPRDRSSRPSVALQLNEELVQAADRSDGRRNAKVMGLGPDSMCPVCHRYKNLDERGRIEPHEYPSGGMCPGEGRAPLWPHGRPRKPRRR